MSLVRFGIVCRWLQFWSRSVNAGRRRQILMNAMLKRQNRLRLRRPCQEVTRLMQIISVTIKRSGNTRIDKQRLETWDTEATKASLRLLMSPFTPSAPGMDHTTYLRHTFHSARELKFVRTQLLSRPWSGQRCDSRMRCTYRMRALVA